MARRRRTSSAPPACWRAQSAGSSRGSPAAAAASTSSPPTRGDCSARIRCGTARGSRRTASPNSASARASWLASSARSSSAARTSGPSSSESVPSPNVAQSRTSESESRERCISALRASGTSGFGLIVATANATASRTSALESSASGKTRPSVPGSPTWPRAATIDALGAAASSTARASSSAPSTTARLFGSTPTSLPSMSAPSVRPRSRSPWSRRALSSRTSSGHSLRMPPMRSQRQSSSYVPRAASIRTSSGRMSHLTRGRRPGRGRWCSPGRDRSGQSPSAGRSAVTLAFPEHVGPAVARGGTALRGPARHEAVTRRAADFNRHPIGRPQTRPDRRIVDPVRSRCCSSTRDRTRISEGRSTSQRPF